MQTFLPFTDYHQSASSLDAKRLFKQAVENKQIFQILLRKKNWIAVEYKLDKRGHLIPRRGFWNHPAVRMWEGFEPEFSKYCFAILDVAKVRGLNVSSLKSWHQATYDIAWSRWQTSPNATFHKPYWLTREFCISHQANLYRKDPVIYASFAHPPFDYLWPKPKSSISYNDTFGPNVPDSQLYQDSTLYHTINSYVNSKVESSRNLVL